MKVLIALPENVLTELAENKTVYAKTNFNNPYSPRAYRLLRQIAQMPNFFFGLKFDHLSEDDYPLVKQSDSANTQAVILDVPDEIMFEHNYYDFSDLIYKCEGYEGFDEDLVQIICDDIRFAQPRFPEEVRQVIFPKIEPNWLVDKIEVASFN